MGTDILISSSQSGTVVAVREDGEVVEIWVEHPEHRRFTGDIYLGVVRTVRPGMEAAFVDIGLERFGFLPGSAAWDHASPADLPGVPSPPPIFREGDEILVQVVREPVGSKGPRLTAAVGLPGRYVVLVPSVGSVGVSRRIGDEAERERLHAMGTELTPAGLGLIMRTMACGVARHLIAEDVSTLEAQWSSLEHRRTTCLAPALLYRSEGAALSAVRDLFGPEVRLVVDDRRLFDAIMAGSAAQGEGAAERIELHGACTPLLSRFAVDAVLDRLLDRVVRLPSGGSIVIEQTEAMVTIDVNTGHFAGGVDQEDTIFCTNLEAAEEIARQLRLRDLGGIIAVDFIDMVNGAHKDALMERFAAALARDRAHTMALPVSRLGVVELSRQRVRPSVAAMQVPCRRCGGTGHVFSPAFAAWRLEQRYAALRSAGGLRGVSLTVCTELEQYLSAHWGGRWERMKADWEGVAVDDCLELAREGFRIATNLDTGNPRVRS